MIDFSPWLPFVFTVFAVLEFLSDVATLLRSHMNGWIPFTGAIKQKNRNNSPNPNPITAAIHWINHYPAYRAVCFVNTYVLDSDLYGG